MEQAMITLNSIEDARKFVTLANHYKDDVEILNTHYNLNAKSIMSVLSVGLIHPISIKVTGNYAHQFIEQISKIILTETI